MGSRSPMTPPISALHRCFARTALRLWRASTGLLGLGAMITALPAHSQSALMPSAHWGASQFLSATDRVDVGVHFFGFTRYGKETRRSAQDSSKLEYTFSPYNDKQETLGFNVLSLSQVQSNWRERRSAAVPANTGAYVRRQAIYLGFVNDYVPEILQNEVIHRGNLRGNNKLERVPRDTLDTFDRTSRGETVLWPLVIGASREYYLRLFYDTDELNGRGRERVYTPLVVGAGATISTVFHEAFVQAGSSLTTVELPSCLSYRSAIALRSVGFGLNARAGLLAPARFFDDVVSQYTSVQGGIRLRAEVFRYPIDVEFVITSSSGSFPARRNDEELQAIDERAGPTQPPDVASVYSAKRPIPERFYSFKLHLGQFVFETYNDALGGKDKGPSFGASASFQIR
jgi:hypothetical protein